MSHSQTCSTSYLPSDKELQLSESENSATQKQTGTMPPAGRQVQPAHLRPALQALLKPCFNAAVLKERKVLSPSDGRPARCDFARIAPEDSGVKALEDVSNGP